MDFEGPGAVGRLEVDREATSWRPLVGAGQLCPARCADCICVRDPRRTDAQEFQETADFPRARRQLHPVLAHEI